MTGPKPSRSSQAARGQTDEGANARAIVIAGASLLVGLALIALAVAGLIRVFRAVSPARPATPTDLSRPALAPPQPNSVEDLRALRERLEAAQRANLEGYAWIDRSAGVVRIPIGRAMDLVAQRGAPDFGPPPPEDIPPTRGGAGGAR